MNHYDAYVSDVTIITDDLDHDAYMKLSTDLQSMGLHVEDMNEDNGVLEGTVPTDKLPEIKSAPGVRYVRVELSYIADYPEGDPRDLDGPVPD